MGLGLELGYVVVLALGMVLGFMCVRERGGVRVRASERVIGVRIKIRVRLRFMI